MTPVYAIAVVAGVLAVLAWIAAVAVSESVDGWSHVDPEARFGSMGRSGAAAVTGFGLAGISATFAGWHPLVAFVAALGGAAGLAAVALRAVTGGGSGAG